MTIIERLRAARTAMNRLDPRLALEILQACETELGQARLTRSDGERVARELEAIRDIAAAAHEGVALARAQLLDLVRAARSLDSYDSEGQRHVEDMGPRTTHRF